MQDQAEGEGGRGHERHHDHHLTMGYEDSSAFRHPSSSTSQGPHHNSREQHRREDSAGRPSSTLFPSASSYGYGGEARSIVTLPPPSALGSPSPSASGSINGSTNNNNVSYGSVMHSSYNPPPPPPSSLYPSHPPIATLNNAYPPRSPPPSLAGPPQKKRKNSIPEMLSEQGPSAYAPPPPSQVLLPPQSSANLTSSSFSASNNNINIISGPSHSGPSSAKDAAGVKRTKTSRACDPCRRKKIRQVFRQLYHLNFLIINTSRSVSPFCIHSCDILQGADSPICSHCKQYGFDCTFHLPITETRWKKRKLDEESAQSPNTTGPPGSSTMAASTSTSSQHQSPMSSAPTPTAAIRRASSDNYSLATQGTTTPNPTASHRNDTRIYGGLPYASLTLMQDRFR